MSAKRTEKGMDLRQIRTREVLLQAFQELLESEEFDRISIGDIASRAGVARPTFYLHYKDKSELLMEPLEQLFSDIAQLPSPGIPGPEGQEQMRALILTTLRHVAQRPALFRLILNGRAGAIASRAIHEQMRQLLERALRASGAASGAVIADEVQFDLSCGFLAGATSGLIGRWLERDMPCDIEELASLLMDLCERDFREVIQPRETPG